MLKGPMRGWRDKLLTATDWTDLPHAPLDDATRAAWVVYRQQLRDLPDTDSTDFPVPPGPLPRLPGVPR